MPGHIKKNEGPDPDPDPWLIVTPELRKKLKAKPYDAKKSCWVPDKASGGYAEGLIESTDGDKVTVKILDVEDVSFAISIKTNDPRCWYRVLLLSLESRHLRLD